jgi:hypothetical protein
MVKVGANRLKFVALGSDALLVQQIASCSVVMISSRAGSSAYLLFTGIAWRKGAPRLRMPSRASL